MEVTKIIEQIDEEIKRLTNARAALLSIGDVKVTKGPGRPKGSKNSKTTAAPVALKRRKLSPEGRKRIADAMKKRWADRRKQATKTAPASKA